MAEQEKATPPVPQRIGIREFRGNLPGFLRQVRQGSSFLVTSRGEVVALVQPPQPPTPPRRQPGTLRGKIRMAPDFDTLPDDLLSIMENGEG
jgi:prevent-host-death family protein